MTSVQSTRRTLCNFRSCVMLLEIDVSTPVALRSHEQRNVLSVIVCKTKCAVCELKKITTTVAFFFNLLFC